MKRITPRARIIVIVFVVSIAAGVGVGLVTHKKQDSLVDKHGCVSFYDRTGTKVLFKDCSVKK